MDAKAEARFPHVTARSYSGSVLTKTQVDADRLAALVAHLRTTMKFCALEGGLFGSVFAVDLSPTDPKAPIRVVVKIPADRIWTGCASRPS